MPEPTSEQRSVIEYLRGDLAVRAGAGSGKTFVLARRFAHALSDHADWPAADMGEIVAITFTRKAAAELVERVRRSLLASDEGVDLSRRMDEAWATTIDSFCAQLLRRHALEAGIDPAFGVASTVEAGVLFDEAFESALAAARREGGPRADLLDAYGIDEIRSCMDAVMRRLRVSGTDARDVQMSVPVDLDQCVGRFETTATEYEVAIRECGSPVNQTQAGNLAVIAEVRSLLQAFSEAADPPASRMGAARLCGAKLSARATKASDLVEPVNDAIAELQGALVGELTIAHARALVELTEEVQSRYEAKKRTRGILDFPDLVTEAVTLMESRPDIATAYRKAFRVVMVDEFQDTNQAQVRLIRALTSDNLCAVGDIQQSIYSFRDADVTVFERLIESVPAVKPLTANYRSHGDVLGVVNDVFSKQVFFGGGFQTLEATRSRSDEVEWPQSTPRVELHIIHASHLGNVRKRSAQAEVFAERVAEMIASGIRPADIVLLLRKMTGAADYANALRARNIPVALASGEAFVIQPEIEEMEAALKAIVAPDDDGALTRLLRGRMVALSDNALLALRERAGRRSLWSALVMAADGEETPGLSGDDHARAVETARVLAELRLAHASMALADTIHAIVHAFDFDLTLLASGPTGARAWANVLKLADVAAEFEARFQGDAGAFLEYLGDYRKHNANEAAASAARVDCAVRIASVHSAKGLEFPVVFVAELDDAMCRSEGRYFYVDRTSAGMMLGRKMPPDGLPFEKARDLTYQSLADADKRRQIDEEKRIFYVACTRAREALVLLGAGKPSDPSDANLCGLVLQAIGSPSEGGVIQLDNGARLRLEIHMPEEWAEKTQTAVCLSESSDALEDGDLPIPDQGHTAGASTGPLERLPRHFPEVVSYSTLWSYTRCARRYRDEHILGHVRVGEESEAIRFGSAVHSVLETVRGGAPANQSVGSAIATHHLDAQMVEQLNAAIGNALESETAKRAERADRAERECPFSVELGPSRLAGTMDLIGWEGDKVLIVDYKTESAPQTSTSQQGRTALADELAPHPLQAACYALAAFMSGARHAEVVFLFVQARDVTATYHFDADDAEEIQDRLLKMLDELRDRRFGPRDRYDHAACGDCLVRGPGCPRYSSADSTR